MMEEAGKKVAEQETAGKKAAGKKASAQEAADQTGSGGAVNVEEVLVMEDYTEKESGQKPGGIYPQEQWEAIVEAVLFTMGQSVELKQLAVAIDQDDKTTKQVVESLKARYEREKRGMQIIELESSYQMCTRSEYYENLIRVAATPKKQVLTEVVLETLSIIAYKQPVTKMEIEKIRGVKSDHAVNRLVEYNLVYEVGRLDAPGRPALFATTEEFLRRFGVGSTEDLPTLNPEAEEEIKSEVEEELQLRMEEFGGTPASGEAAAASEAEDQTEEALDAAAATAEEIFNTNRLDLEGGT